MSKKHQTPEDITSQIDDIISPDNMSQEEAIEFLEEIENYCGGLIAGIQNDIEQETEDNALPD